MIPIEVRYELERKQLYCRYQKVFLSSFSSDLLTILFRSTFIHLYSDYSVLTLYKCKWPVVLPFQSFASMDVVILVLYIVSKPVSNMPVSQSLIVKLWYSATLGHGFMATWLPTCGRSEGPPLSRGGGYTWTLPHALKVFIVLTTLLWLIWFACFPTPFQGWGINVAYFVYCMYIYI